MRRHKGKGEWLGGVRTLRTPVTGEGEPYRPVGLLWMDPVDGALLGARMEHPDAGLEHAAEHLREVMAEPMSGRPRTPARIRTASGALAEALATSLAGAPPPVEIVVAPTPELDEAFDAMEAMLEARGEAPGWLDAGASPDAVAGYFDAMSALHIVAPWEIVPDDETLIRVDCPALDVEGAVLNVIGQIGESFGLLLFADRTGFDAFIALAASPSLLLDPEVSDVLPPHVALTFDRREDVAAELVEEVRRHGWSVPDEEAWPGMVLIDRESGLRSPTDRDIALGEAIARALTAAILTDTSALVAAAAPGESGSWSYAGSVGTAAGELDVSLTLVEGGAGRERTGAAQPTESQDPAALLGALAALQQDAAGDELDLDETQRLTDALFACFRASPEAAPFERPLEGPDLLARLAAQFLGLTVVALRGSDLDEVLFEIAPKQVTAPPDIAREVIATARALFVWLGREHALEQAEELIELLGDDAVRELERRLDDPAEFGPAKTMMMEALAAGVDLSDPKAVDEFMRSRIGTRPRALSGDPFGAPHHDVDGFPAAPSGPPLTPEQRRARQKKRKNDRKAARKARKKNR